MNKFANLIGRKFYLFIYIGSNDAENKSVIIGSREEVIYVTVYYLNKNRVKIRLLKVRLFIT